MFMPLYQLMRLTLKDPLVFVKIISLVCLQTRNVFDFYSATLCKSKWTLCSGKINRLFFFHYFEIYILKGTLDNDEKNYY